MPDTLPDGFCLWEMEDSAYTVGLIGTGAGFLSILDIIHDEAVAEFLPPMTLAAVSEPGPEREKLRDPRVAGLPVYATYQEMLAAHPEINLLIELAGKRYKIKQIVASLPEGVSFIDHTASFFLCALNKFATVTARCQVNLDNQRLLLRAVLDEVPEDILLLDRNGRVEDVNSNVCRNLHATKEELLGKPCWEVHAIRPDLPFCRPDRNDCPFHVSLNTGAKAESLETRVSEDGRLLYYRVYAYPIFDSRHQVAHVLVMRRDITSRTQSEKLAQHSEKLGVVERLSAYLAHEIRNPLFAIGGFTNSLLKSPNLSEREREKVQIIMEETARLDKILKDILGYARPGADAPAQVDVAGVAREALGVMQGGFLPAGAQVVLDARENLPKAVAHEDTLRRAVMHLIANAVDALDGQGRVDVEVFLRDGQVAPCVRDTGRGMSQDVLEHVFSPFFTTKHKGYGLGLSMLRKAVEDWGGQVEVTSREGQGTSVTLLLAPVLATGLPAASGPAGPAGENS